MLRVVFLSPKMSIVSSSSSSRFSIDTTLVSRVVMGAFGVAPAFKIFGEFVGNDTIGRLRLRNPIGPVEGLSDGFRRVVIAFRANDGFLAGNRRHWHRKTLSW